jgi:hypothetical protein
VAREGYCVLPPVLLGMVFQIFNILYGIGTLQGVRTGAVYTDNFVPTRVRSSLVNLWDFKVGGPCRGSE